MEIIFWPISPISQKRRLGLGSFSAADDSDGKYPRDLLLLLVSQDAAVIASAGQDFS
jgi:hypothetical protein